MSGYNSSCSQMWTSEDGWPQGPPQPEGLSWKPLCLQGHHTQGLTSEQSPGTLMGNGRPMPPLHRQHLGLAVRRSHARGAAGPEAPRAEALTPTWRARQGRRPDSPVLAVLSIPTSTLPPSPPLRLLCAEAAFRCLVLQGGERAWEGRLTPAEPRRRGRRDRSTSVGAREGRGEDRTAHGKGKKRQSQY